MALVRKRTHLQLYERALEAAGIPFITSRRGGLLHALEAQDLIALLETLVMPHADLKLAHSLKSPIFGGTDNDLLLLGISDGSSSNQAEPQPMANLMPKPIKGAHWWNRLARVSGLADCPQTLQRAWRLLNGWRAHVGTLPVHDLLDRIYYEGDIEARYAAAAPAAMRPQIAANLRAFMQLALTQDAGRYPTLAGFIRELKNLIDDADAAPGEGLAADGENAVRLLTIHGSKGLESPIVWLLGGSDHNHAGAYDVLAPWPPSDAAPQHFSLFGTKQDRGAFRAAWFEEEDALAERESTNLLYVALTRAEQALIVSGDAKKNAWLARVASAWQEANHPANLPAVEHSGTPPAIPVAPRMHAPAIGQRTPPANHTAATAAGELFHACLEHHAPPGAAKDLSALAVRLGIAVDRYAAIERHARALVNRPELTRFFDPGQFLRARNELELLDADGRSQRLDRVVEFRNEVWILDYKTGEDALLETDDTLRKSHGDQLSRYTALLGQIYTDKVIRSALLLADGRFIPVPAA